MPWSRCVYVFFFIRLFLSLLFSRQFIVWLCAIHLTNRNFLSQIELCMQHYFVHTDVQVLFLLFVDFAQVLRLNLGFVFMLCVCLTCSQLEPFMLWLHLNTYTRTQHEWLLLDYNARIELNCVCFFFHMEILLVPSFLSL